ncbi:MAG TPA: hypothetical protein VN025_16720 [Candidatus Dormibacteraeota bacterium]|jgi:hypothetical protein|nr:hypothetical protein [Candidatus Dormibacteraeota bacterium]
MSTNQTQIAWPLKKPQQLVYVELGPNNGGMMLGVCEQGLSFRAVSPLRADGPINFMFALDGKTRLQGVGEIVWSEDGGKSGGLKFTNVSPQFRELLRSWLSSESNPKNIGREITPAAAIPLDSIEKIRSHAHAGNVEEAKPPASPRSRDTKPTEPKQPEVKPAEKLVPATPPPPEPIAVKPLVPRHVEIKPAEELVAESKPVEQPVVVPPLPQPNPLEAKPVIAAPVEPKPVEPKPIGKTAAEFVLPPAESKPQEHAQPVNSLPKLRLPLASSPAEPAQQDTSNIPVQPKAQTTASAAPLPLLEVSQRPAEVAPTVASPPDSILATSEEIGADYSLPDEAVVAEHPRLNRAAAAGIIGLALAIILGALILSFRGEVGKMLIHLGEALSGEEPKPAGAQSSSIPAAIDDSSYPPVARPAQHNAPTPSLKPEPQSAASPNVSHSDAVQQIKDLPAPVDSGNGQKEFDQARNILKGNRRQRDLSRAVSLLWTGVGKGYVPADVTLADLYARGDGVEQSCDQARVLLEAAIQKGSPEARRRLDLLKQQGCP